MASAAASEEHDGRRDRAVAWGAALALIALALATRLLFFRDWGVNFDADEALIAVQATEILHGRFALFLPGQSYMGSLPSAIAAPLVGLFGAHPNVVRLAPLLWIVPGLLALFALERRGDGRLARGGTGRWLLAILWAFPPAVLFQAGVKARGGNLEGMVLGLWSVALVWPEPTPAGQRVSRRRVLLQAAAGGLLCGLGLWTHDQVLFFVPLLATLLLLTRADRIRRVAAFMAGAVVGYLPLWLPLLVPFDLGPPGLEGTEMRLAPAALFSVDALRAAIQIVPQALTTGVGFRGVGGLANAIYVVAAVGASIAGVALAFRRGGRPWRDSPALMVSLWLAFASALALLVAPAYREDPQWFRYTLFLTPLFVVAPARALLAIRRRAALTLGCAGLIALLAAHASERAVPGWDFVPAARRADLVRELEQRGITRVATDWRLAYVLRFLSGDRILASSHNPARFPEVNAAVEFASGVFHVRPGESDGGFAIRPRPIDPPAAFRQAFAALDARRTLFAAYEPIPLLPAAAIRRDWRGWPYRRPLAAFTAIVWQPEQAPAAVRPAIEGELERLERSGKFRTLAIWDERKILARP